jgi:predicted dehydrogenase
MNACMSIGLALIGCGGIALANHLPGFALCGEQARVVALCDSDPVVLERASARAGVSAAFTDFRRALDHPAVNAVVIATPNASHAPIALAAVAAGKHVLCEKPLAMSHAEALGMLRAAESAGVRHMTAFTYRFVPAMRYMAHLVAAGAIGRPYHFRANRFQDWGSRALGWRQVKALAGSGELGDMLSHRIDFAHILVGDIRRLVADTRRFVDDRGGQPSELEDWVAMLAEFASGATGVLESTKLATGRGEGGTSRDYCEVNGDSGTLVYLLERPNEIQIGKRGESGLRTVAVPKEFLKLPGSPRDPGAGDPLVTFRYDQDVEFVHAIVEQRPCRPSFADGVNVQAVMDAALESARDRRWVDVPRSAPSG